MPTIDDGVEVALSTTIKVADLSGRVLMAFLEKLLDTIQGDPNNSKRYFQFEKGKKGKQKLHSLISKHNQQDIQATKNLSKEEYKAIQKEFKKSGVDFSVKEISKGEYSVFFVGKDSAVIEKGIERALNKYSIKREKQKNREEKKYDKSKFNTQDLKKNHKEKQKKNQEKNMDKDKSKNQNLSR